MATPITWRNVSAPQANPAGALGVASGAFGGAARTALERVKSIREGKDRDQADLTNQALSSLIADGEITSDELANLPEGVDTGSIIEAFNTDRVNRANIAQSGARTDLLGQQSIKATRENSPEFLADEKAFRDQEFENTQLTTQLRQDELNLRKSLLSKEVKSAEGRTAVNSLWASTQTQNERLIDDRINGFVTQWDSQNPDATPEQRSRYVQSVNDSRQAWVADAQAAALPGLYQQALRDYPYLTPADISSTEVGRLTDDARAISLEGAKELSRLNVARKAMAKKTSDGQLWNMVGGPDNWTLTDSVEAGKRNRLKSTEAVGYITSNFGVSDFDSGENKGKAASILRQVGGNKEAFHAVFDNSTVINSDGAFTFSDKIRWDEADTLARQYGNSLRTKASVIAEGAPNTSGIVTLEAHQRRLDTRGADAQTLTGDDTVEGSAPDLTAIASQIVSSNPEEQKLGAENFKSRKNALINALDNVASTVKNRPANKGLMRQIRLALTAAGRDKKIEGPAGPVPFGGPLKAVLRTPEERVQTLITAEQLIARLLEQDAVNTQERTNIARQTAVNKLLEE